MRAPLQWYQISSRLQGEQSYLTSLPYFKLERTHNDKAGYFAAIGKLHFTGPRSGKQHCIRIRLEYPRRFPKKVQHVFDHDEIFAPGPAGHLLSNHELCLTLLERGEFTLETEYLTEEILGAALGWFHKRLLYERTKAWPGPAERHGLNAVIDLLVERHVVRDATEMTAWLQKNATTPSGTLCDPNLYAPCPCGSGKALKFCHCEELKPMFDRLGRISHGHLLTDVLDVKEGGA